MDPQTDPRLRPLQHCCTLCGRRCHPNGDFACGCLEAWRWEMRLFRLYAVVVLTLIGVVPIALLIWEWTR